MRNRTPLQMAALAVGAVFVAVGVLGFIPGITTNYGDVWSEFVGSDSEAELLGLFQVNGLHNLVHLAIGVAGIAMAGTAAAARTYLVGFGAAYLVLWIYGLIIDFDSAANFVSLNTADNWLHLVLGVGMVALGVVLGRGATQRAAEPRGGV